MIFLLTIQLYIERRRPTSALIYINISMWSSVQEQEKAQFMLKAVFNLNYHNWYFSVAWGLKITVHRLNILELYDVVNTTRCKASVKDYSVQRG